MMRDVELGETEPVWFHFGDFYVPDQAGKGRMAGEIQRTEEGFTSLHYPGSKIYELGTYENFRDALDAFMAWRINNRKETAR